MDAKSDSVSGDPRTRVSFPRRPERLEAVHGFHPDGDGPFAYAASFGGAKAYFIRDNADRWHRVSEAVNLVDQLYADMDSPLGMSIEPIEEGQGLDVHDATMKVTLMTLPFNRAGA